LEDNFAKEGTHGIRIVPDYSVTASKLQQPNLRLVNSKFDNSEHPDSAASAIFGGYIQISQVPNFSFAPNVEISSTIFRMGSAQEGGVLYYGMFDYV
jgi:hypothetical protein